MPAPINPAQPNKTAPPPACKKLKSAGKRPIATSLAMFMANIHAIIARPINTYFGSGRRLNSAAAVAQSTIASEIL